MPRNTTEMLPDGLPFMAHSPLLETTEPWRYDPCLGLEGLATLRMVEEAENACRRRDGRCYVPQSAASRDELVFSSPAASLGLAGAFAAALGASAGLVRAWHGKGRCIDSMILHAVYGAADSVPAALAGAVAFPVLRVLVRAGISELTTLARNTLWNRRNGERSP